MAELWPPGEENLNFPPDPDINLYLGSNSEIQSKNYFLRIKIFLSKWFSCGQMEKKIIISLLIQMLLCISEAIPRYKVSYYFLWIKIFLSKWPSCGHLEKKILISLLIQILLCISEAIPRYKAVIIFWELKFSSPSGLVVATWGRKS